MFKSNWGVKTHIRCAYPDNYRDSIVNKTNITVRKAEEDSSDYRILCKQKSEELQSLQENIMFWKDKLETACYTNDNDFSLLQNI